MRRSRESNERRKRELQDRILSRVAASPAACLRVLRRLPKSRAAALLSALSGSLGKEYTRLIFDDCLSASEWDRLDAPDGSDLNEGVSAAFEDLFSLLEEECVASEITTFPADPFQFLSELSPDRLKKLLQGEEPSRIAVISATWAPERVRTLAEVIGRDAAPALVLSISRLERLPRIAVLQLAMGYAAELQTKNQALPVERETATASDVTWDTRAYTQERDRIIDFLRQENDAVYAEVSGIFDSPAGQA